MLFKRSKILINLNYREFFIICYRHAIIDLTIYLEQDYRLRSIFRKVVTIPYRRHQLV